MMKTVDNLDVLALAGLMLWWLWRFGLFDRPPEKKDEHKPVSDTARSSDAPTQMSPGSQQQAAPSAQPAPPSRRPSSQVLPRERGKGAQRR
jgi:hypothetical protein